MSVDGHQPDPTQRTLETVHREIEGVWERFESRIRAVDAAAAARQAVLDRVPDDTERRIHHLRELQSERFDSIAQQFAERDVRTDQATSSGAQALAAALQAAKELVGAQGEASAAAAVKSETSFTKQIDQIGTIIQTLEKALDARLTELKERIDRGEGNQDGARSGRGERRGDMSLVVTIFGAVLVAVGIIMPLLTR
jgi:hypothetical protein